MTQQSRRTARSLQASLCSYGELHYASLLLGSENPPKHVIFVSVLLLVTSDLILIVVSLPLPLSIPPPLVSCPKPHFPRSPLSPHTTLIWDSHVS